MKISWLILAFYIIALSILPCSDKEECNVVINTELSSPQDHEQHEHEDEHCTPFCHCACCGQQVVFNTIAIPVRSIEEHVAVEKIRTIFNEQVISDYFASIWQPPQLS